MRFLIFILLLALPLPAFAGMAEARDLARSQNCQVTAIVPVAMETGAGADTTYKVTCQLAGQMSEELKKANGTLFVRCEAALCWVLKKGE